MALVTIKDKFQVTLPAKLRRAMDLRVGDVVEATAHPQGILLRPKTLVDRAVAAEAMAALLADMTPLPGDESKSEDEILAEATADIAAARAARRQAKA